MAMVLSNRAKAGVFLFLGGVQFTIVWFLAEVTYPGYSVASNYISDLGTNCPSGGGACYVPPSWLFFNSSQVIYGMLVLLSAYFMQRFFRWRPLTGLIALAGFGLVGVGVFNESFAFLHGIFSLVIFLFAGLSAIVATRFQKAPMSYFSVILGVITLVAFVLYAPDSGVSNGSLLGIGAGGLERLIVYPVLIWSVAFGGHLMGMEDKPRA